MKFIRVYLWKMSLQQINLMQLNKKYLKDLISENIENVVFVKHTKN